MSEQEILVKAINKAAPFEWGGNSVIYAEVGEQWHYINLQYKGKKWADVILEDTEYSSLIFSHEFAKSFFGEEHFTGIVTEISGNITINYVPHPAFSEGNHSAWVYHLQQMVLDKEPIKYLEQFL